MNNFSSILFSARRNRFVEYSLINNFFLELKKKWKSTCNFTGCEGFGIFTWTNEFREGVNVITSMSTSLWWLAHKMVGYLEGSKGTFWNVTVSRSPLEIFSKKDFSSEVQPEGPFSTQRYARGGRKVNFFTIALTMRMETLSVFPISTNWTSNSVLLGSLKIFPRYQRPSTLDLTMQAALFFTQLSFSSHLSERITIC